MELSILVPALGRLAAVGLLAAFDVADLRWVAAGYALGAVAGVVVSWRAAEVVLGKARVFLPDLGAARDARGLLTLRRHGARDDRDLACPSPAGPSPEGTTPSFGSSTSASPRSPSSWRFPS